jgi:hypothetical protein
MSLATAVEIIPSAARDRIFVLNGPLLSGSSNDLNFIKTRPSRNGRDAAKMSDDQLFPFFGHSLKSFIEILSHKE